MKIDESIEILMQLADYDHQQGIQRGEQAIKLGMEALKLIRRERLLGINPVETRLPGEET